METARVYATIPLSLKKKLDEKIAGNDAIKLSDVIYLALERYLNPEPEVTHTVTSVDRGIWSGLTIPHTPVKTVQDPDIKEAFVISKMYSPAMPNKLRMMGIDPLDVIKAKRARARGAIYDKTLEKYFDLV